jgi:hypothetical protein
MLNTNHISATKAARSSPNGGEPPGLIGVGVMGKPRSSERYVNDWEILVYQRDARWIACFFQSDLKHEHVTGHSPDYVRNKAKRRIDSIEKRSPGRMQPTQ